MMNANQLHSHTQTPRDLGAIPQEGGGVRFCVWAPRRKEVILRLHEPVEAAITMSGTGDGYFEAVVEGVSGGIRYSYLLDGKVERPDPASQWQPNGVHAASAYVDPQYPWQATEWRGIPLRDYIIYELHVGVFTPEGTFDAAIARIPYLLELGVTAVELMPVAAFPGERNWGYDGVFPFAVQHSYGGPLGMKRFVDACHLHGLAVILDVVYNHLGPEGNYLRDFGPYFTTRYRTPWGEAVNFDGEESAPVRHYFVQNALYWVTQFRIDALRLDATDTIHDMSARHILEELATAVRQRGELLNRRIYTIAETAANDSRWIRPAAQGGFGLDAQWNDDIHHALRRTLTGEQRGYFVDYPEPSQLAKGLHEGFIYSGQYSAYRKRNHGNDASDLSPRKFVVCCQNHDQVGNRMRGDRLGHSVSLPALKLAAAFVLLSPYIPLLFMGEEYNEQAPFPYFVHHGDPGLIKAVREGRKREFAAFAWEGEPPDPQAEATFLSAKLEPELREQEPNMELLHWYQAVIALRKQNPCFQPGSRDGMRVEWDPVTSIIWVLRQRAGAICVVAFHLADRLAEVSFPFEEGRWRTILASVSRVQNEMTTTPGVPVSLGPYEVCIWESIVPSPGLAHLRHINSETR